MDPISFAFGAFGLAAQLFQLGLSGYNFISDASSTGTDFDLLQNSLYIEKERYIKWGNAWGITEPDIHKEFKPGSPQYNVIIGTLARISAVFGSADEMRRRYGISPKELEKAAITITQSSVSYTDSAISTCETVGKPSALRKFGRKLKAPFRRRHSHGSAIEVRKVANASSGSDVPVLDDTTFQHLNDPRILKMNDATPGLHAEISRISEASSMLAKTLPYYKKIRWAITDKIKFEQLIEVVRRYNDGLESVMPVIEATIQREQRIKILDWLWRGDFQARHKNLQSIRCNGTGVEFLEGRNYVDWVAGRPPSVLWCEGIAGAGKTMLTSIVLDDMETRIHPQKEGIAHIYFDYNNPAEQVPSKIICCLLKQLLSRKRHLPDSVEAFYNSFSDKATIPGFAALFDLLRALAFEFSKIWIFLDALDECETKCRDTILESLFELDKETFRLFTTARPHLTYTKAVHQTLQTLSRIEIRPNSNDLEGCVRQRLLNAKQALKPMFVEKAAQELVAGASGMFLFVSLRIDHILDQTSEREMERALETIPSTLDGLYDLMMMKIDRQSESRRVLARKALAWVSLAKRPLRPSELVEALAVEQGDTDLVESDIREIDFIVDTCAGLVINDRNSKVLRLTHKTTQEYLHAKNIVPPAAHIDLAKTCITYLTFKCFEPSKTDRPNLELLRRHSSQSQYLFSPRYQKYKFMSYAATNWCYHTKGLGEDDPALIEQLKQFFGSKSKWEFFLDIIQTNRYEFAWEVHGMIPLHFVARAGLFRMVERLLKDGENIEARQNSHTTALHFATKYGHDEVVKLLLDWGANIEARDEDEETVLHFAARAGHGSIVELLLNRGANIDVLDENKATVLHFAAQDGFHLVVDQLLNRGMDPNAKQVNGWTPMHFAAKFGYPLVIEMLLDRGADIEAVQKQGATALHFAAKYGFHLVVKLLLDRGADIGARQKQGSTPLHLAANQGRSLIVGLLLDRGADIEAIQNQGVTALHLAANYGHHAVVELLLTRGANVEAAGKKHKWKPLHFAARAGHSKVIELLLNRGADISVRDADGSAPLHLATLDGHNVAVELLLERGADVNARRKGGETALDIAESLKNEKAIELLLARGGVRGNESAGTARLMY